MTQLFYGLQLLKNDLFSVWDNRKLLFKM